MKTIYRDIKIKGIKKDCLIRDSKLFAWIDSDFESYGASVPFPDTTAAKTFTVQEITHDMTFSQIFENPETQWMTQGQILAFVKSNWYKLKQDGYATFFLFKSGDKFFVASVLVDSDGLLAYVFRFERDLVWYAENRHRVVVPATSISEPLENDSLTFSNLGTLKKKIIEKYGERDGNRFNKYFTEEEDENDCFLWVGAHDSDGYGNWRIGGRLGNNLKPHRVTYEVMNGEIEKGMVIDHLCRVRDCVNPEHMEAVTIGENVKRGEAKLFKKKTTIIEEF